MRFRMLTAQCVLAGLLVPGLGLAQAPDQTSQSAAPAAALVKLLEAKGIQAVAAKDPDNAGRYVAALYVPGAELLVVSASYSAPAVLEQRLKAQQYQEVYVDLQSASTDKFFIEDLQANGLQSACEAGQPFDTVSMKGADIRLNGDWAGQQLTESAYKARFDAADKRYAKMLSALIARLQPPATTVR